MLKELDAHVVKGEADDLIIQDFVQEYGEKVLSEPPAKGFNSIAWYIPGAAFVIGLGIVVTLIRLWRQRDVARLATAASAPPAPRTSVSELHDVQLERARKQADKETEEL
jgi:cytochrome c-type biogenesis protein CcmH